MVERKEAEAAREALLEAQRVAEEAERAKTAEQRKRAEGLDKALTVAGVRVTRRQSLIDELVALQKELKAAARRIR